MYIPPNHTAESVMADILHVTTALAKNMRFGYHEIEDLKQEGFIFAINGLPEYDPTKSSLRTFLYTHIRFRFINLKRKQYQRLSPPCSQCVFCCESSRNCLDIPSSTCLEFSEKDECTKYRGWLKRNARKRNLMDTGDGTTTHNEFCHSVLHEYDEVDIKEILEIIDVHLPSKLRVDFCRMRDGVGVSKKQRLEVEKAILEICGGDIEF